MRHGSGGGGGTPNINAISLRTDDTLEVNLAISEGPIGGLLEGPRSFFLGGTPLTSPNGESNFNPFELHVYHGGDNPTPVKNALGGVTSNTSVNVTLAQDIPVVRVTPSTAQGVVDLLELRILIQNLVWNQDDGDQRNNTLSLNIEFREEGALEWIAFLPNQLRYEFNGRVQGAVKELSRRVPRISGNWEIRITKLNPDSGSGRIADVQWESIQTTTQEDRAYENLAIVRGISEASDQLSGIPQFSGVYAGRLIKVPSNYNPVTREYTGIWDGTFKLAHTDNPAWCAYDMATNTRYGARAYFPHLQVDRFSFYEAAQWCDVLVPRPGGGYQPRYTYNDYIQQSRQGLQLLHFMVSIFGGRLVEDAGGVLVCKLDKPGSPVQIYGLESISDERFNYQYTDVESRPNTLNVSFINPNLDWEKDVREVKLSEFVTRNGRTLGNFTAVACVDVFEALRRAQMRLIQANTETATVSFRTARQGLLLEAYDIMGIADPDMNWALTGRIKSISGAKIHLRDPLTLPVGVDLSFSVQTPSGVHAVAVQSAVAFSTELTVVSGTLPSDLPTRAQFAIEHGSLGLIKPFRVLTIEEDDKDPNFVQITGLEINTSKYSDVDNMVFSVEDSIDTAQAFKPQSFSSIQAVSGTAQLIRQGDGTIESRIRVTWKNGRPGKTRVKYRRLDREEFQTIEVEGEEAYIRNVQDGMVYVIQLEAGASPWTLSQVFTHLVTGKSQVPATPTGWVGQQGIGSVELFGSLHPDTDFQGFRVYGATPASTNLTLLDQISSTRYSRSVPEGDPYSRYRVSAVDTTGNESELTDFIEIGPLSGPVDGVDGVDGTSTFRASIFKRAASKPALPAGGSFNFDTNLLTPPSGWSDLPPEGTDPLYISLALASISGSSGIDSSLTWTAAALFVQDGADGAAGADGVPGATGNSTFQASIFVRAATQPNTPSGGTFNFGTNTLTPPAGWSKTPPPGSDPLWSAQFLFSISGATGTATASAWSIPDILVVNGAAGGSGVDGVRGPGRWNVPVVALPTTSAGANSDFIGFSNTPPSPVSGDQAWFYIGPVATPTAQGVWLYNGTSWIEQTEVIDGSLIVQDTITATSLSAISANIGTLKSAETGERVEITDGRITVYNAAGTAVVVIGDLSGFV